MKFTILLAYFLLSFGIYGQSGHLEKNGNEEPEKMEGGVWEIIVSGVSFFPLEEDEHKEKETVYGTELHLTYWLNHKWAIGASYTLKFEDEGENLNEFALIGSYKPTKWMTINAGPDFSIPTSEPESELRISAYLESEINFFINEHIHLGPVIGGLLGSESEIFAGIHVGYEF